MRDRGTLAGIRAGTWISYLADYRANSIIFDLDLGRSFWDERLSIDAAFLYARTKDAGAGGMDVLRAQFRNEPGQGAMEGAFAERAIKLAQAHPPVFTRHPPETLIRRHLP